MGNTQSPSSDPRFVSASRAFTQNEVDDIKSMFQSLASQSHTDGQFVSQSVFQAYFGLPTPLGDTMFHLVTQQQTRNNDQRLTFEDLLIAKATYDKGTKHEVEEFLYQLLDVTRDGIVGRSDVQAVLKCMFDLIFSPSDSENGSCSRDDIVNIFLDAAHFSQRDEGSSEATMSFEDFRSLCTHLPSVRKFLGNLLIPHHPGKLGSQVPHLLHSENIDSNMLILRKEFSWHIGGALSQLELGEWKLLYHSAFNGRSFNTFLGYIINNVGPTVLIIKDKEGYIYGGYASQPWERHGDFYGDMKSFLFQLYPKASIFRPTGTNNNLQWCAVNFSSESIPNGVGFGGKVNHFGLFLSAGFDQGHTFACTTFGSPCLSKTSQIHPEVIECWGIIKKGRQQEGREATQGTTILERFKEDRHMLNMVGLANSSE